MKCIIRWILAVSLLFSSQGFAGWGANEERDVRESIEAFRESDPDMQAFFDKAWGYAVYPDVGKAGMGIGGASVDADYQDGVAVFTLAKGGLMYEAAMGGQKFSYQPRWPA